MVELLGDYLDANGTLSFLNLPAPSGDTVGNLFLYDLPELPDNSVGLLQYGGTPPTETFGVPLLQEHPRLQVTVRHSDIATAFSWSYSIMQVLTSIKNQTIGGVRFLRVRTVSSPFEIGPDAKNLERVMTNYEVSKEMG